MILHGNQRGGARDLALHLLKDENEHVDLYELRGFVSDNLMSALNEAYALSKGTKAKQFLYSLSINPPAPENASIKDFLEAAERVEQELGLSNQPRAIVFHEKQGRRHAHAVWSRIDTAEMKAIQLSYTKRKLHEISRELYLKHDWQMPPGFMSSEERDLRNFTMAQWQQAKRSGKDPRTVKTVLQECYAVSDTQSVFEQALKQRGYTLARGDRRGFVALDHFCNPFSISKKWIGKTAKEVRAKLTDPDSLPTVEEAREQIARTVQTRLSELHEQQAAAIDTRLSDLEIKRQHMVDKQRHEREALEQAQTERQAEETKARQARFNKGLRGLLDHFTGKCRKVKKQNERETLEALQRDQHEKDALIFSHLDQRRVLQVRIERLKKFEIDRGLVLSQDAQQYRDVQERKRETVEFNRLAQRPRQRGPELEP